MLIKEHRWAKEVKACFTGRSSRADQHAVDFVRGHERFCFQVPGARFSIDHAWSGEKLRTCTWVIKMRYSAVRKQNTSGFDDSIRPSGNRMSWSCTNWQADTIDSHLILHRWRLRELASLNSLPCSQTMSLYIIQKWSRIMHPVFTRITSSCHCIYPVPFSRRCYFCRSTPFLRSRINERVVRTRNTEGCRTPLRIAKPMIRRRLALLSSFQRTSSGKYFS